MGRKIAEHPSDAATKTPHPLTHKGRMPIIERVGANHKHRKVKIPSPLHPNPYIKRMLIVRKAWVNIYDIL